jgi:hypothetical protein
MVAGRDRKGWVWRDSYFDGRRWGGKEGKEEEGGKEKKEQGMREEIRKRRTRTNGEKEK